MLYPRLNELIIVQEPSSFPFVSYSLSFLLYSALPLSLETLNWISQLHMPTYTVSVYSCMLGYGNCRPVLLRWLRPRTQQENSVWYEEISPKPFCSKLNLSCLLAVAVIALQECMCYDFSALLHWGYLAEQIDCRITDLETPNCPKPCVCLYFPVSLLKFNGK